MALQLLQGPNENLCGVGPESYAILFLTIALWVADFGLGE